MTAVYLPVLGRHAIFLEPEKGEHLATVLCPPGAPLFAAVAGRCTVVADDLVGEIVLRDDRTAAYVHYRRLNARMVQITEGSTVAAGDLVGFASDVFSSDPGGVLIGIKDEHDHWLDPIGFFSMALDPADLKREAPVVPPNPVSRSRRRIERSPIAPVEESPQVESEPVDEIVLVAEQAPEPAPVPEPSPPSPPTELPPADDNEIDLTQTAEDPVEPVEPVAPGDASQLVSRRARPRR